MKAQGPGIAAVGGNNGSWEEATLLALPVLKRVSPLRVAAGILLILFVSIRDDLLFISGSPSALPSAALGLYFRSGFPGEGRQLSFGSGRGC